jgi:RNA polymerase sigma-70 factor (ECF subfamily)
MRTEQTLHNEENELIRQALAGDLDSFNQLVLMYQNMAYNHAHSISGDPSMAEDATQESFIKAFQALRTYRGGSFRGWLLRIVTNAVYDILRRSNKHPTQPLFAVDEEGEEIESSYWLVDPNASVQQVIEEKEFSAAIYKVLDELPDAYRTVINLIDVQELDYREAAQVLNLPLGTIKSRLARARLQMQKKLESNLDYAGRVRNENTFFAE